MHVCSETLQTSDVLSSSCDHQCLLSIEIYILLTQSSSVLMDASFRVALSSNTKILWKRDTSPSIFLQEAYSKKEASFEASWLY